MTNRNQTKHTPGPWEIEKNEKQNFTCFVQGQDTNLICRVYDYPDSPDTHLIAAAPELLEACKLAVNKLLEWEGNFTDFNKGTVRFEIEKAIAKAEGGVNNV